MQFSYQFPEITERLVLVSSGGLGPEVSPVLRAAALPGADLFIAATATAGRSAGAVLGRGLTAVGLRPNADIAEVARGYASLADPDRRAAFLGRVALGHRHRWSACPRRRPALPRRGRARSASSGVRAIRSFPFSHGEDAHEAIPAVALRSSTASAICHSSRSRRGSSRCSNGFSRRPSRRSSMPRSGAPGSGSPPTRPKSTVLIRDHRAERLSGAHEVGAIGLRRGRAGDASASYRAASSGVAFDGRP